MPLRQQLAEHGFESNDDYEFPLRSLFAADISHLRCLHIAGDSGRRKTALANALAHALDYPHILYLDFSQPPPALPPAPASLAADDGSPTEPPLSGFDRVLIEACAFSEAERTVLILDQLQAAPFADQMRLFHFVQSREWDAGNASVRANSRHLLLILVSEQPLYHSLAHLSFRLWADSSGGHFDFRPEEFGLGQDAREMFARFGELFAALGTAPTSSEFTRILSDARQFVRTAEQLRHTLFGWMEHIDRGLLYAPQLTPALDAAVHALNHYIGMDEIELGE
ncbi:MAG: hypothetical protein AB7V26_06580 [Lysobacterales bacterium]